MRFLKAAADGRKALAHRVGTFNAKLLLLSLLVVFAEGSALAPFICTVS